MLRGCVTQDACLRLGTLSPELPALRLANCNFAFSRDAAQAHCEGVSRELAEREAHLEEQLQAARLQASAFAESQMEAATQAQEKLEGHLAVLRATAADWQVRPCHCGTGGHKSPCWKAT